MVRLWYRRDCTMVADCMWYSCKLVCVPCVFSTFTMVEPWQMKHNHGFFRNIAYMYTAHTLAVVSLILLLLQLFYQCFYYSHYHLRYHYRCHQCYHHHLMLCAISLYVYCRKRSRNDCFTITITSMVQPRFTIVVPW